MKSRQYLLASRPVGLPTAENWEFVETELPDMTSGQLLVEVKYISLDPAMRGWMNDGKSYIEPVQIGDVMRAGAVGKVVRSTDEQFNEGDYVYGQFGVQDYALVSSKGIHKVDPALAPLERYHHERPDGRGRRGRSRPIFSEPRRRCGASLDSEVLDDQYARGRHAVCHDVRPPGRHASNGRDSAAPCLRACRAAGADRRAGDRLGDFVGDAGPLDGLLRRRRVHHFFSRWGVGTWCPFGGEARIRCYGGGGPPVDEAPPARRKSRPRRLTEE